MCGTRMRNSNLNPLPAVIIDWPERWLLQHNRFVIVGSSSPRGIVLSGVVDRRGG